MPRARTFRRTQTADFEFYLNEMQTYLNLGLTYAEIGRRMGKDHTTIIHHIKKHGLTRPINAANLQKIMKKLPAEKKLSPLTLCIQYLHDREWHKGTICRALGIENEDVLNHHLYLYKKYPHDLFPVKLTEGQLRFLGKVIEKFEPKWFKYRHLIDEPINEGSSYAALCKRHKIKIYKDTWTIGASVKRDEEPPAVFLEPSMAHTSD